ncbi:MAG: His/Gly/Thr/Pro-type tRNA ligase C-terminal domain-containing protein [Planctomycetota bacterium]
MSSNPIRESAASTENSSNFPPTDLFADRLRLGEALAMAARELFPDAIDVSQPRVVEAGVRVEIHLPVETAIRLESVQAAWEHHVHALIPSVHCLPGFRLGSIIPLDPSSRHSAKETRIPRANGGACSYRIHGIVLDTPGAVADYMERSQRIETWDHVATGASLDLFLRRSTKPGDIDWQPAGIAMLQRIRQAAESTLADHGLVGEFIESDLGRETETVGHGLWSLTRGASSRIRLPSAAESFTLFLERWINATQSLAESMGFPSLFATMVDPRQQSDSQYSAWSKEVCERSHVAMEILKPWNGTWRLTLSAENSLGRACELARVQAATSEQEPDRLEAWLPSSYEHMLAAILEHRGGHLPTWLAPLQAIVLPVNAAQNEAASKLADHLRQKGLRVSATPRGGTLSGHVRDAIRKKVPHLLVLGERESRMDKVSWRRRWPGSQRDESVGELADELRRRVATRIWDCDPPMQNDPEDGPPGRLKE